MNESPDHPPFFEWSVDIWKLSLMAILFLTLLVWAMIGGQ